MTAQEYQKILETEQPFIEYKGQLMQMPFYISPKLTEYPFDILSNLGDLPIKVSEEENDFKENILEILYPGGRVIYVEEAGVLLPMMVRIFGVTTEPGIQSLNTKHLDTLIYFDQVREDKMNEGEYLHFGDIHLEVERIDGERGNLKEWWSSDRKG